MIKLNYQTLVVSTFYKKDIGKYKTLVQKSCKKINQRINVKTFKKTKFFNINKIAKVTQLFDEVIILKLDSTTAILKKKILIHQL